MTARRKMFQKKNQIPLKKQTNCKRKMKRRVLIKKKLRKIPKLKKTRRRETMMLLLKL